MNTHDIDIELPAEFRSGNDVPVTIATIKRERMEEILRTAIEANRKSQGEVVVTKTPEGKIIAVTRQDDEGKILSVIAEADRQRRDEEQQPFGYFRALPFGWTDCAATDEGAIALYERPQARGEPVYLLFTEEGTAWTETNEPTYLWWKSQGTRPVRILYTAPQPANPRPTDDELLDQALRERDAASEMADKLANAIAKHLGVEIGEHSSANHPWYRALDAIEAAQPAEPVKVPSDAEIREVFLANGFTIKPGQDDLKEYVYEAARDLIARYGNTPQSNGQEDNHD